MNTLALVDVTVLEVELQKFADIHLGAAQHRRNLDRHVEYRFEVFSIMIVWLTLAAVGALLARAFARA